MSIFDRLPGFNGPVPSAALDKSIYFSTLLYIHFFCLSICFSAFFRRKLGKELSLVKSGFNEPDFTFRLIDINTSLLLFSLPLGCLFSVDVVGDDALHRPDFATSSRVA